MPELPEVEYARRKLEQWTLGRTIVHAAAPASRLLRPMAASTFVQKLKGRSVRAVERRGKWLRLTLDDGQLLFSHLGMSGKWIERPKADEGARSEKLRLELSASKKHGAPATVRLVDPRMFGRLILSPPGKDIEGWSELGPDPLATPIDVHRLADVLAGSKRTIKEKLLDQTVLAGVGNIQATEALWKAKIDPRSPAGALDMPHLRALARAIKWTIDRTIAMQGDDEIAYLEEGRQAKEANPFVIYGHGGEACPRCKTEHKLAKIVLAGRGTVFCPNCQIRFGELVGKNEKPTRVPPKAPVRKPRAASPRS